MILVQNARSQPGIVVFDFDGTLSTGRNSMTMWSQIWSTIGRPDLGRALYEDFHNGLITREKWFQLTENVFRFFLTRTELDIVSSCIELRTDAIQTLRLLSASGYNLYILSGGILTIIKKVLGVNTCFFVHISANDILFDSGGKMQKIIMTPFDYDGKAVYIKNLVGQTHTPMDRVYFLGNSVNDMSVLSLPIKTICISPPVTSQKFIAQWDHVCDNLLSASHFILG